MTDTMIFAVVFTIAFMFQTLNILKMNSVYKMTGGAVRSVEDLEAVKSAINHSMRSAIIYIAFSVMFGIFLAWYVLSGHVLSAVKLIFLFGISTLIMGLIGRVFEKRVRNMRIETDDNVIADKYAYYIDQWDKPQFTIRDIE